MPHKSPPVSEQEWNSSRYAENARFVSDLGGAVLDLLNPQPSERILGCGDGALTEKISSAGAIVVGLDSSEDMVAAAKTRGLDARVGDAFHLNFSAEFDAVFSNAALHWMKRDPYSVIRGVWNALKPGGRFAAEMGGFGNVAAITVALCATLEQFGVEGPAAFIPLVLSDCGRVPRFAGSSAAHDREICDTPRQNCGPALALRIERQKGESRERQLPHTPVVEDCRTAIPVRI